MILNDFSIQSIWSPNFFQRVAGKKKNLNGVLPTVELNDQTLE